MKRGREIDPDEILIDARNIQKFDTDQFEGRLEKPIRRSTLYATGGLFVLLAFVFVIQATDLSIVHGAEYDEKSANNLLRPVPIFASRGAVFDRNGTPLVWNAPNTDTATTTLGGFVEDMVPHREYATTTGLAHVLG